MSQSNNEVIMRSGGRRIKRPDEPLKQNVTGKIITPIVYGCVAEMLHKNERADQKSGINGRPSGMRIQRKQDFMGQTDINRRVG